MPIGYVMKVLAAFTICLGAVMAQINTIVSPRSAYSIPTQFFIIAAFLFLVAWLTYLYYHHSKNDGKKPK